MEQPVTAWDGTERRRSPRLRKIIDDLQVGVRENRDAIAALTQHVFHLNERVDAIRESSPKG